MARYVKAEPGPGHSVIYTDTNGKLWKLEGYGWVSKSEGISLTLAGKVDAVVATSSSGNHFLRARPNSKTSDNLGVVG
jgi:hypothetical protein